MVILPEMACNLAANCKFLYGFTCSLSDDATDVDCEVHTLKGIHTFRKNRNTKISRCNPWGTTVKPFPSLKKKMAEYLRQRQTIANPFANRSYPSRPKPSPFAKKTRSQAHKKKHSSYQTTQRYTFQT